MGDTENASFHSGSGFWRERLALAQAKAFQDAQRISIIEGTDSVPRPKSGAVSNAVGTYNQAPGQLPDRPPLSPTPFPVPVLSPGGVANGPEASPPRSAKDIGTVGIIGAGAAGMYIAMILDFFEVPYEIIEASPRAGGRVFTKRFDDQKESKGNNKWNYFDVGPMRYPDIPIMWRVFDLFRERLDIGDKLLNYYMSCDNQFLLYNSKRCKQSDLKASADPFHDGTLNGGLVPAEWLTAGVDYWIDLCFKPFKKILARDVKDKYEIDKGPAWKIVTKYDSYSTRMLMSLEIHDHQPEHDFFLDKPAYPDAVINWLERMTMGSGMFDWSFVDMLTDEMEFDYPEKNPPPRDAAGPGFSVRFGGEAAVSKDWNWYCLEGGSQIFADAMRDKIDQRQTGRIHFNQRVTAISPVKNVKPMKVTYVEEGVEKTKNFNFVISTIPLPALRFVDMDGCNLSYAQLEGMRSLQYGDSCKIGLKFKSRWWQDLKTGSIKGGQSKTDRIARTVVFPSYGIDDPDADAVMIASYTWSQDASRIGGMVKGRHSPEEQVLVNNLLKDLALLHDVGYDMLKDELVDWFAWSWYDDPNVLGAFAFFGPGQFSNIYSAWGQGAAGGRLLFAGEALSPQHAWVEGALCSGYDAIFKLFELNNLQKDKDTLKEKWGSPKADKALVKKHEEILTTQALFGAVLSYSAAWTDDSKSRHEAVVEMFKTITGSD